jgi:hypothetical protein
MATTISALDGTKSSISYFISSYTNETVFVNVYGPRYGYGNPLANFNLTTAWSSFRSVFAREASTIRPGLVALSSITGQATMLPVLTAFDAWSIKYPAYKIEKIGTADVKNHLALLNGRDTRRVLNIITLTGVNDLDVWYKTYILPLK